MSEAEIVRDLEMIQEAIFEIARSVECNSFDGLTQRVIDLLPGPEEEAKVDGVMYVPSHVVRLEPTLDTGDGPEL